MVSVVARDGHRALWVNGGEAAHRKILGFKSPAETRHVGECRFKGQGTGEHLAVRSEDPEVRVPGVTGEQLVHQLLGVALITCANVGRFGNRQEELLGLADYLFLFFLCLLGETHGPLSPVGGLAPAIFAGLMDREDDERSARDQNKEEQPAAKSAQALNETPQRGSHLQQSHMLRKILVLPHGEVYSPGMTIRSE